MSAALKRIAEVLLGDFVKNAFFKSLSYGIIFALIMTYIIGAIVGVFQPQTSFPYFRLLTANAPYWIGILFVSFALLFAILGYVSQLNARDDLLTPLRKKLVGLWEVRTQSWTIQPDKVAFGWVTSHCTIKIEPIGGKLLLQFEISKSDIFKDQKIDITTTAFSFDGATRKLVYFYEAQLELKTPVGAPPDNITKMDFPFLGVLTIKFDDEEKVNFMDGHWYDINNGVYNLARRMNTLDGLAQLSEAVEKGAATFGGATEFKRLQAPPGTPVGSD
jgi:hypothetical protein